MSPQLQIDYILLLVKDSNSKCGKWKIMSLKLVWGGIRCSLENGGFSDQFCESAVCMRQRSL